MSAIADERICHVYRNRENYPTEANPSKFTEEIGDGTTEEVDICGLPMQSQMIGDIEWWFCVECDRPKTSWPVRLPTA